MTATEDNELIDRARHWLDALDTAASRSQTAPDGRIVAQMAQAYVLVAIAEALIPVVERLMEAEL